MKKELFIYFSVFLLVFLIFDLVLSNIISSTIISCLGLIFGFLNILVFRLYTINIKNEKKILKNEAMHDGMTGLLNYKFFSKRLDEEIERSKRYNENMTLLFPNRLIHGFQA